ncbi:hypothetical protein P152DRAFT_86880 [Eremomyces bilateralis CBS 781.70]|uniref:Uncharacterized protein n=1 Tax=Eremomyces bilateralis CBS 781.70 TaxID=1392243 RepID=A0A6G1FYV1_9PEZI|nr:uncharacterized protein P152DRAFT_86880 [Eremomyces bilateralis CBS 781.70]KAF1810881.1 hypothetical protein P152DRAFT_86880 [Eremomyces bilateralis CBS 781.70]
MAKETSDGNKTESYLQNSYRAVFRAMYDQTDSNIFEYSCFDYLKFHLFGDQGIFAVALQLGCPRILKYAVEEALKGENEQKWAREAAKDPVNWLRLGLQLYSISITKEAILHLAGRIAQLHALPPNAFPEPVLRTVFSICDYLQSYRAEVEADVQNYVRKTLLPPRVNSGFVVKYNKNDLADIGFDLIAFSVFEEWWRLTKVRMARLARVAWHAAIGDEKVVVDGAILRMMMNDEPDGGFQFYHRLKSNPEENLLPRDQVERLTRRYHVTPKAVGIIYHKLENLKAGVLDLFGAILKNSSILNKVEAAMDKSDPLEGKDSVVSPYLHFTCIDLADERVRVILEQCEGFSWDESILENEEGVHS